jgi:hypothetical protein
MFQAPNAATSEIWRLAGLAVLNKNVEVIWNVTPCSLAYRNILSPSSRFIPMKVQKVQNDATYLSDYTASQTRRSLISIINSFQLQKYSPWHHMNDVATPRMHYFRLLVGGVFGLPHKVTVTYGDVCAKWRCGKLHRERHWYAAGLAARTGLSLQSVEPGSRGAFWGSRQWLSNFEIG